MYLKFMENGALGVFDLSEDYKIPHRTGSVSGSWKSNLGVPDRHGHFTVQVPVQ